MKTLRPPAILACLLLAGIACAQTINFSDKAGKMTLTRITSWSTRLNPGNILHFKALGHKLHGEWANLGLKVDADSIEGDAKRVGAVGTGSSLELQNATLTGGVHLVVDQKGQVVTMDCASAVIKSDGTVMNVTLEGGVIIDREAPATGEKLHATGSHGSAQVTMANGLGKATLFGPVTIDMNRKSTQATTTHVNAKAKKLDINRTADPSTIILTGDVVIQGNDPVIAGDIRASRAVILVDAKGNVIGIDADGDPGVMRFKERGKVGAA